MEKIVKQKLNVQKDWTPNFSMFKHTECLFSSDRTKGAQSESLGFKYSLQKFWMLSQVNDCLFSVEFNIQVSPLII